LFGKLFFNIKVSNKVIKRDYKAQKTSFFNILDELTLVKPGELTLVNLVYKAPITGKIS
jgi:hypothetical protein